jgi:DNA-binding response OmpR family regulator
MEKVYVLVANSERRLSSFIESLVLDACFGHACVEATRVVRVDELIKLGSSGAYQLVIVVADNLLPGPVLRSPWVSADEAVQAIREIRSQCDTPLIAVAVFPGDEASLLEAGAECVVRLPFEAEQLRSEVRRVLRLADRVEEPKPSGWSLNDLLWRGWRRLKSA